MLLARRPLHLSRLSSEKHDGFPQKSRNNSSSCEHLLSGPKNRWLWELLRHPDKPIIDAMPIGNVGSCIKNGGAKVDKPSQCRVGARFDYEGIRIVSKSRAVMIRVGPWLSSVRRSRLSPLTR